MLAAHFPFLIAAALALALPLYAQGLPKEKGAARTVKMFNVFCLSQLPDLEGVAKAAGFGEFAQITGEELKQFEPETPAEELHAWRFHEAGAEYVLTAARSKPDEKFKKEVPAFARSTSFACTLKFPADDPAEKVLTELITLLGRDPDESRSEGSMHVHAWTRKTKKHLSRVQYYALAKDGTPGVLSASAFVKD